MTKTHFEALKCAVTIISTECKMQQYCRDCPLFQVTCGIGQELYYPASWEPEKIGVKDNE